MPKKRSWESKKFTNHARFNVPLENVVAFLEGKNIQSLKNQKKGLRLTLQKRVRQKVKPCQLRLKWGGWPAPSLLIQ